MRAASLLFTVVAGDLSTVTMRTRKTLSSAKMPSNVLTIFRASEDVAQRTMAETLSTSGSESINSADTSST